MSWLGLASRRAALVFVHDIIMTGAAFLIALYLRVGDEVFSTYARAVWLGLPLTVVAGAVVYRVLGLYRGIWRYASVPDLIQIAKAVSLVCLSVTLALFLLTRLEDVPRSLPVLLWFVLIALLGGPRFLYRLLKDGRIGDLRAGPGDGRVPLLLIGVGDAAELFVRAVVGNRSSPYSVVGILDEKGRRVGRAVHGVPVLGRVDELARVVETLKRRGQPPQRLVLTRRSGEIPGALVQRLLDEADRLGLPVSRLPSPHELKEGLAEGRIELRPVAVEDLLGRPQAALDRSAIFALIQGRRVLITGAGGTIGGELTRQIAALGPAELVMLENSEFNLYSIDLEVGEIASDLPRHRVLCDVRDRARVLAIFQRFKPELVFHAAALKHVPLVEENLTEGVLTNAIGTRNVADAAYAVRCRAMVLISTDKAVRPASYMGATKRVAEAYVQALDLGVLKDPAMRETSATRFMTLRFGNVLGSSGSVVPLFQRQLAQGGPLTVTHPEMRRYFMTVKEAVELVLHASAHGAAKPAERGKIMVLDMGEPVKIVDLAHQMIRLAGLRPGVDVGITYVGLRPGEKLFEEILDPEEAPTRTEANGVFIASPKIIDYAFLDRALRELEQAAHSDDAARLTQIIETIIGGFTPTAQREASHA